MDTVGKYIVIHMNERHAHIVFFGAPGDGDRVTSVGGTIRGEAPVGLWLEIDHVVNPSGNEAKLDKRPKHSTLIRWEYITNAKIFPAKPEAGGLTPGQYL